MKKVYYLSLFIFCSLFFKNSFGQSATTYGKEFNLMFFPNYSFQSQLSIDISSRSLSNVVIHTQFKDTTVLVLPDLITTVVLPSQAALYPFQAFQISKNTVNIKSDNLITVFATNSAMRSTDATMVLPSTLLGTEYIVQTYNEMDVQYPAFAGVIAVEDGTEVEITPNEDMNGMYAANEPFLIQLNKGECFMLSSSDPTGTRIRSTNPCKKIAAFGAAQCTYIRAPFCDHLYEQLWPTNFWGRKYLTVPLLTRKKGDSYRVLAKTDDTKVTINKGEQEFTLNALNFKDLLLTKASVIESNNPISLIQLSNGGGFDNIGENADPFMVAVLPVEQAIDYITFNTANGFAEDSIFHYINVTSKTSDINSVVLDTNLLYNNFKPFQADKDYSYAQVEVKNILPFLSTHILASTGGLNAIAYGFGFHYSYGYTVGGLAINTAFDFTHDPVTCTQKEIAFRAEDSELNFAKTYLWNFGDGTTSTLKNPSHAYTAPGNYTVKLIILSGNCFKDSVQKVVNVKIREVTKPTVTVTKDQVICKGGSVQLNASGGKTYSWFPADGLDNPNIANPVATPSKKTRYTVTVSADSLCAFDTASVSISFKPLPVAKAYYEIDGFNAQFRSSTFDDVSGWTWNFGDGSPLSYNMEPKHVYAAKGIYNVFLEVRRDCGDKNFVNFDINIDGGTDQDSVKNDDTDPNYVFNHNSQNPQVKIYPNPISNSFKMESDLKIQSAKLFSIDGRILQEWKGMQEVYTLDTKIAQGIYFVQVVFENSRASNTLKVLVN